MGIVGYIGKKATEGLVKSLGKEALKTGAVVGLTGATSKLESKVQRTRREFEMKYPDYEILWIYNYHGDKKKGLTIGDKYEENALYYLESKSFHSSRDIFFVERSSELFRFHVGHFKKVTIYQEKEVVGKLEGSGSSTRITIDDKEITYNNKNVRLDNNIIAEIEHCSLMSGFAIKYKDASLLRYIALGVLGSHVYEFFTEA